jgi:hypothetical protein
MPRQKLEAQEFTGDLDRLIELNCTHDLSPEDEARARHHVLALFGPHAEAILRACGRAAAARRDLAAATEQLARLRGGVQLRGVVTGVDNGRVSLMLGGTERLLPRPEDLPLRIGQTVLTDADGQTVLDAGDFLLAGQTFRYCERLHGRYALVQPLREAQHEEARQVALVAESLDLDSLKPGDRVLGWAFDYGSWVLVTHALGPIQRLVEDDERSRRIVTREDIVGLDEFLEEMELLFLDPTEPDYAAVFEACSPALVGVALAGQPGVGKTLVADYCASLVRSRGGRALYRTGSHYLSKWVGEGAAVMRADFAVLENAYEETGVRPLLIIDELEAIAVDRSHMTALQGGYLDILDTLLSLLTHTKARMIGISNLTTRLVDTALTRDGRLYPLRFPATLDAEQVATLATRCLAGMPLGPASLNGSSREFGDTLSDLIFASSGTLAELLRVQLADGRVLTFGARDLTTGAVVADGIIRRTVARAAHRDLKAGRPSPAPLTLEELRAATIRYFEERSRTITRDNVRSVLQERIPEDQAVMKVEPVLRAGMR